ncbi:ACP S-malonyltransferase [Chitinophagales bacterium]|nr:ACP S-malonyltransferase [Chitinophagales bacterium]
MKKAFVFPGQGSQFVGMGKELIQERSSFKEYMDQSKEILGFDIAKIMLEGPEEKLLQTSVTQPAIFVHAVADALTREEFNPEAVAGHSLGEFSALVAAKVLSFEDGLQLVKARANAMQKACDVQKSGMAAIIGLENEQVEEICSSIDELVVPANYNTIGQVVISGTERGIDIAVDKFKEAGARMAIKLKVNGAFHSPLMKSAEEELAAQIEAITFNMPVCPIYQNVVAAPVVDVEEIKMNLIKQLTAPVLWTQSVIRMKADGFESFEEVGPGKVLSGLIRKIR